ncbi:MAG: restriction endonuclease subunit S [Lachnospiraceae bacterium]|nr:restriction endonuclease subunit S [Lachnospiraceae bacterium]
MDNWKKVILSDVLKEKGYIRGPFGSALKRAELLSEGIPVYEQQHAIYNSRDFRFYIDEKKLVEMKRFQVKTNDLIISCSGTVGKVSIIEDDAPKGIISQALLLLRVNEDVILPLYLKYFFTSREGYNAIVSRSSGSVQINISRRNVIENIPLYLPSLDIQQKIVGILSSVDEKIRKNNEINDNLEEQALALFRHYFMDFAPYGGVAPSNWKEVSLDDVCTRITDGSHYSPADAPESPYPMYSVKDMETYGFNSSSCKHISEEDFRKMQKGDCVPLLNDILVAKDGSYLKAIFICSEEKEEAILSSIAIFRPDTNIIIPEILLYLLKQPSVRKDVGDNYVSGSALPRIVLKDFKKYRFMLPPMDEQLKIGSVLHTIRMQTKAKIDEIQCLSSTRDALLPKLMSGVLDVSDIDL